MTEKVYGFRGEDIFIFEKKGKEHILVERIGDETISGNLAFELVPVVSLEWLEQLCKSEEGKASQKAKEWFHKSTEAKTDIEKKICLEAEQKSDGMIKAFKFILKKAIKETKKRGRV